MFRTGTLAVVSLLALMSEGCGSITTSRGSIPAAQTQCTTAQVQIGVADGFLVGLCGCAEADGTVYPAGTPLTCNANTTNSTVFFHYIGTKLRHQIAATQGGTFFVASALSDPSTTDYLRVHAVTLTSGTYNFLDLYSTLQGQIIVP
ncbi:hypothetical protein K2X30_11655 [bacterium]|nr:hypothetical protein [bacterium]